MERGTDKKTMILTLQDGRRPLRGGCRGNPVLAPQAVPPVVRAAVHGGGVTEHVTVARGAQDVHGALVSPGGAAL